MTQEGPPDSGSIPLCVTPPGSGLENRNQSSFTADRARTVKPIPSLLAKHTDLDELPAGLPNENLKTCKAHPAHTPSHANPFGPTIRSGAAPALPPSRRRRSTPIVQESPSVVTGACGPRHRRPDGRRRAKASRLAPRPPGTDSGDRQNTSLGEGPFRSKRVVSCLPISRNTWMGVLEPFGKTCGNPTDCNWRKLCRDKGRNG